MSNVLTAIIAPIAVCAVTIYVTLLIDEKNCNRRSVSNMYERVYFPIFNLVNNTAYSDKIKAQAITILTQSSGVFPIELSEKTANLTPDNYPVFQEYITTACDSCRKTLHYSELHILDGGELEASYSLGLSCIALSFSIVPFVVKVDTKIGLFFAIISGILIVLSIRLKRLSNSKKKR